nr:hypothetical protein [Desulfobulbus sp.]
MLLLKLTDFALYLLNQSCVLFLLQNLFELLHVVPHQTYPLNHNIVGHPLIAPEHKDVGNRYGSIFVNQQGLNLRPLAFDSLLGELNLLPGVVINFSNIGVLQQLRKQALKLILLLVAEVAPLLAQDALAHFAKIKPFPNNIDHSLALLLLGKRFQSGIRKQSRDLVQKRLELFDGIRGSRSRRRHRRQAEEE